MGEWFGDWFRAFEPGYHFEIQEIRELDSGVIFMRASHGGRGRLSGVEVTGETAYLYRVRDGKISQVGFFDTRERSARGRRATGVVPDRNRLDCRA